MFTDNKEDGESIVATSDMCLYCFDTLIKELLPKSQSHGDTSVYNDNIRNQLENQQYTPPAVECPLFVTWSKYSKRYPPPPIINVDNVAHKLSSGLITPTTTTTTTSESNITEFSTTDTDNEEVELQQEDYVDSKYDLRGCIGTLSPKSLQQSLSDFALTSALHDHRFDPIELHEIPYLKVGVSLLVKYETCSDCYDWKVGVHGIIIKFSIESSSHRTKSYNATYLPEIAFEQQWTQQETVVSLIRKAGYRGVITEELLQGIHCTRYQSSKFQLTYQEYCHTMKVRHGDNNIDGLDLQNVLTAAAVDEAMGRQSRTKSSCVIF